MTLPVEDFSALGTGDPEMEWHTLETRRPRLVTHGDKQGPSQLLTRLFYGPDVPATQESVNIPWAGLFNRVLNLLVHQRLDRWPFS